MDEESAISEKQALVRAYGLYWIREAVNWDSPQLPGLRMKSRITKLNSTFKVKEVNAWTQEGVYVLYSAGKIMYVGQALSREGIGNRLHAHHTKPRLSGRWDSFSWFGFSGFDSDGNKRTDRTVIATDQNTLIRTVELAVILSAEPQMNRATGKFFGAERLNQIIKRVDKEPTNTDIMALLREMKKQL